MSDVANAHPNVPSGARYQYFDFADKKNKTQKDWNCETLRAKGSAHATCSPLTRTGDGGDQQHPSHSGLHVLVQRHHQRQGQGGAQDLLCAHRDEPLAVPGECNAVIVFPAPSVCGRNTQQ